MSPPRIALLIAALLTIGVICAWLGRERPVGSVLLILTCIVWLIVDNYFEGFVLFKVSESNGLTLADLFALAGLGVAAMQLRRRR